MTPQDTVAIIGGCVSILTAIILGNVWLIRAVVRAELTKFEERLNRGNP
jgi:uncharacterized protein YneF (UPF0154 family)